MVSSSKESVNSVREKVSGADYLLASFASFKFWVGYIRKGLIATVRPFKSPRQVSVKPPDATAMFLSLSSPEESTAVAGSRRVALHTVPRAIMYFAFCESRVGYTFVIAMD